MARRIFCALIMFAALTSAGCVGGPVSDAAPEGALCCHEPLSQGETVVLKGATCLAEFRDAQIQPVTFLTDSDVTPVQFPFIGPAEAIKINNGGNSALSFLKQRKYIDAIKEYNIRYIIYMYLLTQEELRSKPYSKEDYQAAIYSSRKKWTEASMLMIDAKHVEVSGYVHQRSEGQIRVVPLLLIFSRPDTQASACEKLAQVAARLFAGKCDDSVCARR